jgi:hypothetical protein
MKIKNKITFFIFIASLIIFTECSNADVVRLKKGREIEGAITGETNDTVTIDIGIGEATLNKSDIETIRRAVKANAAIYYLRAIDMADYGKYGAGKNKIEALQKKNFILDAKELSAILDDNKKCLDEMDKGLAIKECDFYFEDKYNPFGGSIQKRNQKEVMYLHSLLLSRGRYYESRKDFSRAVDSYLSALTFAVQIAQGPDPEFRTAAIVTEKDAYPIIEEYLNSKNTDPAICKKIFDFLKDYDKLHFSAKDFMTGCRDFFLSPFKSYNREITRWVREDTKPDDKARAKAQDFADEVTKQAKELADRYYGNFISAAGTDAEKDWKSASDEYGQLVSETKPPLLEDDVDLSIFVAKTLGNVEEYDKKDPKMVAVTILSALLPYDKRSMDLYRENRKELKKLESLAAQK